MRLGYSVLPSSELKEWGKEEGIEKWFVDNSDTIMELPELEKLCNFIRDGDEIGIYHSNAYVRSVFKCISKIKDFSNLRIEFANIDYNEEAIDFVSKLFGTSLKSEYIVKEEDVDFEEDGHKYISKKQSDVSGRGVTWYVVKKDAWNKYLEFYKNNKVNDTKELIKLMAAKFGISNYLATKWIENPEPKYFVD